MFFVGKKNQRQRPRSVSFLSKFGSRASKDVPIMIDWLSEVLLLRENSSLIWDNVQYHPKLVYNFLYVSQGVVLPDSISNLFEQGAQLPDSIDRLVRFYNLESAERLRQEITRLIELSMWEARRDLPAGYNVRAFCDIHICYDQPRGLLNTFLDLFFHWRRSFTWNERVIPILEQLEQPPTPTPTDSPKSVFEWIETIENEQILEY
jgi:hypothetical protein